MAYPLPPSKQGNEVRAKSIILRLSMRIGCRLFSVVFVLASLFISNMSCLAGLFPPMNRSKNFSVSTVTRVYVQSNTASSRPAQTPKSEAQIIALNDVIAQGSVVPACLVVLILIAILCLVLKPHVLKIADPPLSESFSKILFRVIISPNAP
jgi:hypothetical protein